jgi:hypothetical protein
LLPEKTFEITMLEVAHILNSSISAFKYFFVDGLYPK